MAANFLRALRKAVDFIQEDGSLEILGRKSKYSEICEQAKEYYDVLILLYEVTLSRSTRDILEELRQHIDKTLEDIESITTYDAANFLETRSKTIRAVEAIIAELRKTEKNINITTVATGSGGLVGTCLAAAGILLMPLSAGLSLGLIIGGISLGIGSGVTGLGSQGAKLLIEKNCIKNVKRSLEMEKQVVDALFKKFQQIQEHLCKIQELLVTLTSTITVIENKYAPDADVTGLAKTSTRSVANILAKGISIFDAFTDASKLAIDGGVVKSGAMTTKGTVGKAVTAAAKPAAKVAGLTLLAIGAAVDVWSIIDGSVKLHKGSTSAVAVDIETKVLFPLQEDEQGLTNFFRNLTDSQ